MNFGHCIGKPKILTANCALFQSCDMIRAGFPVINILYQPFVGFMGRREAAPIYIYMLRAVTYNRNLNLRAF